MTKRRERDAENQPQNDREGEIHNETNRGGTTSAVDTRADDHRNRKPLNDRPPWAIFWIVLFGEGNSRRLAR